MSSVLPRQLLRIRDKYVLLTAARNEEAHIEKTIQAVISQTILPVTWVIVSDGSTDRTDEIVRNYESTYDFIQIVRRNSNKRNFASKVQAIRAGYQKLKGLKYDLIGNLDADVTFGPEYFEKLLEKFRENSDLGIGGGIVHEQFGEKFRPQVISLNSVAGAVQLFRRLCYEEIGGYPPISGGGEDAATEIMSRMYGWHVQSFPDLTVFHHGRVRNGKRSILAARFQKGITNYLLGYHPLFQIVSCLSRIAERPIFLGSLLTFSGFCWSWIRGYPMQLTREAIQYLRSEQIQRIRDLLSTARQGTRG